MASRSSTVIISSSPIAKVGGLLTLTIAEINGTWLPFSLADGPLAPKYDSHPFGDWPPNLVITRGSTGSLLYYTKHRYGHRIEEARLPVNAILIEVLPHIWGLLHL